MTRVSEAVAKVVVFALKGASSGDDDDDDWLNPTEVALKLQSSQNQYVAFVRHLQPPLLLALVCLFFH